MKEPENILLVDDQEEPARASIRALEFFVPKERIHYVSDAQKAMEYLESNGADLVFLDIDMPGTSGFSLASYIDERHKGLPYVFLTGYADFAAKSYDYEPLDFLTKPIDTVRLGKTFERFGRSLPERETGRVALHTKQGYTLVDSENLLYIGKSRRKVSLFFKDGQEISVSMSMDELDVIFSDYGFFRCHQSYLIPLDGIAAIVPGTYGQTYEAALEGGVRVPVSRGRLTPLKEELRRCGVRFI